MKKAYTKPFMMNNSIAKKHYRANTSFVLREIAGESILVSVGNGIADFCGIVSLNTSAKVLWCALQRGATKDELTQELKNHFSISEAKAAEDVEKSLILLQKCRMVTCES